MTDSSDLTSDQYSLGAVSRVTVAEIVEAAKVICCTALRVHGVDEFAELSPKHRKEVKEEVLRAFRALGIEEPLREYWENEDEN